MLEKEGKVIERATLESFGAKESDTKPTEGEFESAKGSSIPADGSVIKAFLLHDVKEDNLSKKNLKLKRELPFQNLGLISQSELST